MSDAEISPTNLKKVTNTHNPIKTYKVIVVGDSNVGKTSLTYRFCAREFLESPEATIGVDLRQRTLTVEGEDIQLQLWDTAGQERYRKAMTRNYYHNIHAVIFVYDVTNMSSFESLKGWIEEVNENCLSDVPRILVGNKSDRDVVVNINTVLRFADQHNMPVFETSALLDSQCDNVEAIFLTLAHKLKNHRPMLPKPPDVVSISSGVNDTKSSSWFSCDWFSSWWDN